MTKTTTGFMPTGQSLPIALIRAREAVMVPIREMLAESGLTEQQWRILRVLSESGPMEASKLAGRAALLLPSQTRILQAMEEKGLVTRATVEADRRRQSISVTDRGRDLIERHADRAHEIAEGFRAHLGDAEYETLIDLLSRLQDLSD